MTETTRPYEPNHVHVDRTRTYAIPNNTGPAAINVPLNLPDEGDFTVEAWISNFGGANVWLFEGQIPLAECQARISDVTDLVDCIMCLTGAGPVRRSIAAEWRNLTLFFEGVNASGQTQAATIRVTDRYCK